ncbi:ergosterol biosynthesis ERG4/ERG24 family-domain-containing protein [Aspergillus terricola var. indicus]
MVEYEFSGPLGAAAISFGLPVLLYAFAFTCNDVSSCSIPSLLQYAGLPNVTLAGFFSWEVMLVTVAYYVFGLLLWRLLPAEETHGTKLVHHDHRLFAVILSICAAGTYLHGAEFLYPNRDLRQLAAGGTTGNFIYDFYIGRELNPRVTLSFFGQIDIKTWCEVCPGLSGWILLDLAFYCLTTAVQAYYVHSSQNDESAILTMMDINTDGMGFMLSFGDLVWVPFLYSTQARYLAAFPVHLGWPKISAIGAVFVLGIYIFKAANNQKHLFRTQPDRPAVPVGWWGLSRHINYFGDWLQALPFSLPTGLAGYVILPARLNLPQPISNSQAGTMLDGRVAKAYKRAVRRRILPWVY